MFSKASFLRVVKSQDCVVKSELDNALHGARDHGDALSPLLPEHGSDISIEQVKLCHIYYTHTSTAVFLPL